MGDKTSLLTWKAKRVADKAKNNPKITTILGVLIFLSLCAVALAGLCWFSDALIENTKTLIIGDVGGSTASAFLDNIISLMILLVVFSTVIRTIEFIIEYRESQ